MQLADKGEPLWRNFSKPVVAHAFAVACVGVVRRSDEKSHGALATGTHQVDGNLAKNDTCWVSNSGIRDILIALSENGRP